MTQGLPESIRNPNGGGDLPDQIVRAIKAQQNRPVYYFTIPASLQGAAGIKEVGLVELTGDEEANVGKRMGMNAGTSLAFELAKESLRRLNGVKVTTADGSADIAWNQMCAALRSLVLQEYVRLHTPGDDDAKAFRESRRVELG